MDDLGEVLSLIKPDEKCNYCIRGEIVGKTKKDKVLLAIVKCSSTAGVLIYRYDGDTVVAHDLKLEFVLPINKKFSVSLELDKNNIQAYGKNISVRLTAENSVRLVVELASGDQVGIFIMELKKAINAYKQRISIVGESTFKWLENYTSSISSKSEDSTDGRTTFKSHIPMSNNLSMEPTSSNNEQDNDSVMLDFGSSVLSSNEVLSRSHPQRPSFTSDTSINFRTERETFVRLVLNDRQKEFVDIRQLRFLVCTWNVNGQGPGGDLRQWFTREEGVPDVIAIGFQELDLSKEALMGLDSKREKEWMERVNKSVEKVGQYELIRSVRLVGMLLAVFIKLELHDDVVDIDTKYVGTGIMGMMGNKGGVAVRFQLFNTTVCFVNSHLAAHQEEVERRNQDHRDILVRLGFPESKLTIMDHDVVFWFGDLNYRINLSHDTVRRYIDDEDFQQLGEHDQLILQMRQDKCFKNFKEGYLAFKPTYKYNPGTDDWDSEKDRIPAWCDRVLWCTAESNTVQQMAYASCPEFKLSDHKPVHALFNVNVKVVDKKREKVVLEEVVRELDKRENDFLPQVELTVKELNFGDVQFLEKKTLNFQLRNVGQVAVQYTFIPKLEEKWFCKPWLTVEPSAGLVKQHDSKTLEVSVFVKADTAGPLTAGREKIEDILVLHLQGGKDFFLPISGTYKPSVFGSSIESLVFLYRPMQDAPVAKLIDIGCSEPDGNPQHSKALDLPKELWLLVDHLQKHGMCEPNLFKLSAFEGEFQKIREHLDTKADGNLPGSIHSIAEALLLFLESLEQPVVPFEMYQKCMDCSNNYTLCKQMVARLPESHKNVFTYLTEFLKDLLHYSRWNNLEPKVLATIFGAIMLRPSPVDEEMTEKQLSQQVQRRARFIHHFIALPNNHAIS